jgi:hypothetical protein
MSFKRKSNARPYFTKALFASTCPETGKAIKKGDEIAYYPATKKAFHLESQSADSLRGIEFSQANSMADANY